ncbi:uncharacterized protein LOC108137477 isoform X1 [Drosophila elegans]|uniref:uncharacterized protein LOC108137477 isoform X1 n=2 Tax=Drosophila elegans TaxID=30023 RepID=UPI0007E85959|nr:uncharacterized protein LOC108137477 isoform X1 [Drosophila elegans]
MSTQGKIEEILNKLNISDNDRCEYTQDAISIQNYLVEELKDKDATFRSAYDGLSLGGSYLDRVKLVTPDEFDLHMKLKFPFQITPERDENGFVLLYAPGGRNTAFVSSDGYIRRKDLQGWLRGIFKKVFTSTLSLKCNNTGNSYTVRYTNEGYGCAHSIEAVCGNRSISFDLVPAFEFIWSKWPLADPPVPYQVRVQYPWFAIPQQKSRSSDERTFMVCAPHWEREVMKNHYNLKNVLRLMKGIRDGNSKALPHLSSYMLKSVILQEVSNVNWMRDEGRLLEYMWGKLVERLDNGRLNFFLANGHNIFDRLNQQEINACRTNAHVIFCKLHEAFHQHNVYELQKLFNLN